MTQNIYDDEQFFEGYSRLPRSVEGLDGAPEWPALRALLPDLRGGHQERVDAAQPQTPEYAARKRSALLARDEHVGARGTFGIEKVAVLLDDELAAERNHEQHADPSADERQQKDA